MVIEAANRAIEQARATLRDALKREPTDTETMHALAGMYVSAARVVSAGYIRARPAVIPDLDLDTIEPVK